MFCGSCNKPIVDDAAFCPHCTAPVPGAPAYDDYEYEAFISYRHLPTDRNVAVKLQKALEGFVIPQQLRELKGGSKKLGRLFRDEDELPTASSLPDQIRDALIHSPYLIVICTPQMRESQWVRREVELFASYHGRDRIRIALAAGEPSESFPELLLTRTVVDQDGTVREIEEEPLAADFRDLSRKKFNLEMLRIAAPLIGCGFDDLRQRQKARQQRMLLTATTAIAAVSLVFGSFSYYQQLQIKENYRQVQIKESEFLASESSDLLAKADRHQAISVALAALPESSTSNDRPYVPSAQLALTNALGVYPVQSHWREEYSIPDSWTFTAAFDDDGLMAFIGSDRSVVVWNLRAGFEQVRIDVEGELDLLPDSSYSPVRELVFTDAGLICTSSRAVACFDLETGELKWSVFLEGASATEHAALSPDGTILAVFEESHYPVDNLAQKLSNRIHFIKVADGSAVAVHELSLAETDSMIFATDVHMAFNADGSKLAFAHEGWCLVMDVADGSARQTYLTYPYAMSAQWVAGQLVVTSSENIMLGTSGMVSIEAFDENLNRNWQTSTTSGSSFDSEGASYTSLAEAIGSWRYADTEVDHVAMVVDRSLLFLNAETGEEASSLTLNKPFSGASLIEIEEGVGIAACTGDGYALVKAPNSASGKVLDALTYKTQKNVYAYFTVYDGQAHLVEWSDNPAKFSVYRYVDGLDVGDAPKVESLAGISNMSWNNSYGFVGRAEDEFVSIDPYTFEVKATVGSDVFEEVDIERGLKNLGLSVTENGSFIVYGDRLSSNGSTDYGALVYELSLETGEVLHKLELEGMQPETYYANAVASATLPDCSDGFVAYDVDEVRLVPWDAPDQALAVNPAGNLRGVFYANGLMVGLESNVVERPGGYTLTGSYYTLNVYDVQTGSLVESEINGYAPRLGLKDMVVLSDDGKLLAVACEDAKIRLFDLASGKMLWEASDASASVEYLTFVPETYDVFVQDESGSCMLISREEGKVSATSTLALNYAVDGCWALDDGRLAAKYKMRGLSDSTGLVILEVRDGMLDPIAEIYNGFYVTGDGAQALVIDVENGNSVHAVTLFDLDELIDLAHAEVAGHELTEAEQLLYRAGE